MFSFLKNFFKKKGVDTYAALPLSDCRILRPYLLERCGITSGSAVILAVPYYTEACDAPNRNISAYAVSKDYHHFFEKFFSELQNELKRQFPDHRFAAFYDHSPIDEIEAAAKAGLGVIGKNRLLLTEKYSSYVFLGELITDAMLPSTVGEIRSCPDCGRCSAVCPAEALGECLSALTQKKGLLSVNEKKAIRKYGSAWGCDLCQEVCPYTVAAKKRGSIYSKIDFFHDSPLSHLTSSVLEQMDDCSFAERAYAWRTRRTILRNLQIMENTESNEPQGSEELPPC